MIFLYIFEGHFILALNPVIDTMNEYSVSNPQAMINVSTFMDDLLLLDYFIISNPDKRVYTWRRKTP